MKAETFWRDPAELWLSQWARASVAGIVAELRILCHRHMSGKGSSEAA